MSSLPKTSTNTRPYEAFAIAAGFTLTLPPNTEICYLSSSAAVAGTNVINLPLQAVDGDTVSIVASHAVSGITVAPSGSATILAGPSAVTALTAGTAVKYMNVLGNWLRIG
jgi:hypothetical protein